MFDAVVDTEVIRVLGTFCPDLTPGTCSASSGTLTSRLPGLCLCLSFPSEAGGGAGEIQVREEHASPLWLTLSWVLSCRRRGRMNYHVGILCGSFCISFFASPRWWETNRNKIMFKYDFRIYDGGACVGIGDGRRQRPDGSLDCGRCVMLYVTQEGRRLRRSCLRFRFIPLS